MYFDRLEETKINISPKKLHFTAMNVDANALNKAKVDLEDTATTAFVKDLIRGQVADDTKKLKSKFGQLERQLASLILNPK